MAHDGLTDLKRLRLSLEKSGMSEMNSWDVVYAIERLIERTLDERLAKLTGGRANPSPKETSP